MSVFHEFSSLISDFKNKCFVLILGQFVLIFYDTLDHLTVEGLMLADALLHVHDDLAVSLLERFLFVESVVGSFTRFTSSQILVCSIGHGPHA
jgi:hypothetical protein